MSLDQLSEHEREVVQEVFAFDGNFTAADAPEAQPCDCCGFAHGLFDMFLVDIATQLDRDEPLWDEATERLGATLREALERQRKQSAPAVRTVSEDEARASSQPPASLVDTAVFCETCGQFHPLFDIIAVGILCGLRTQDELEQAIERSKAFLKQLFVSQDATEELGDPEQA